MPGPNQNLFYSFNMGPIHFIGFSTEVYYFLQYGFKQIINQYEWLEQDLKEASAPENRTIRPWIITFGHRPMYCSNLDMDDCTFREDMVRVGVPILRWWGLEDLFYEHGVDLEVWAHEHSYERSWPVYNYNIYNGSENEPYTDPGAPVHIVTGSAVNFNFQLISINICFCRVVAKERTNSNQLCLGLRLEAPIMATAE